MSVNKLFETVEQARETADWKTAFGEPQAAEDKTIIPVAQVSYGFGLGFGIGTAPADDENTPVPDGEGGGAGGGVSSRPLGVIVVTPESVYFEETRDEARITLLGMGMVTLSIYQIAKTLRAILGRK